MEKNECSYKNQNSILIEENNNINASNIINKNIDLPNIINKFKFSIKSWGNYIIEPDLYYQYKYYFFNLNDFKEKLKGNLRDILDKYQYMFEPYKDDLIEYSSTNLEDKPFQRRPKKNLEKIKRGTYFKMHPNENNKIEKKKAIILATIIHKINLNCHKNSFLDKYYIGCIDYNPNGGDIDFLYYPFIPYIDDEIKELDCYEKDNDTYLKLLKEKMESLKEKIKNNLKDEKEKYILKNYLINIIIQKLRVKEDLYNRGILKDGTEKLLYELFDSVNLLILRELESVRDSNILFENVELKDIAIKIIKNIPNEKEIFIFENYINKLYKILLQEINSSKSCYNVLDEKNFKKYLIEKNLDEDIYNEISKIIDLKNEIEKIKNEIEKKIKKIKNENNKNIKGILIIKKLNNNSHLHDKFIVNIIN